jgi:hypothetical protein
VWADDDRPRRRRPAAVVGGAVFLLAAAVLVAGGAFVAGFAALVIGAAALLAPPRSRRRRGAGLIRKTGRRAAGLTWAGVAVAAAGLRWSTRQLGAVARAVGRGASIAAPRVSRVVRTASRRTAQGARRVAAVGGAWLARSADSGVRATLVGGRRAGVVVGVTARQGGSLALELSARARRTAWSEAAHLGTVTSVPAWLDGMRPEETAHAERDAATDRFEADDRVATAQLDPDGAAAAASVGGNEPDTGRPHSAAGEDGAASLGTEPKPPANERGGQDALDPGGDESSARRTEPTARRRERASPATKQASAETKPESAASEQSSAGDEKGPAAKEHGSARKRSTGSSGSAAAGTSDATESPSPPRRRSARAPRTTTPQGERTPQQSR